MVGVRIERRLPDERRREYDVLAICGEYLLITEAKSKLRPEDIPDFLEVLRDVRTFLPEYAEKRIIGAVATFYSESSLQTYVTRQGLILLGIVDGLMTVLNQEQVRIQEF